MNYNQYYRLLRMFSDPMHPYFPLWIETLRSIGSSRTWNIELVPPTPIPGVSLTDGLAITTSLHRILLETGIALTPATSAFDPRSWYALLRYGLDFAGTGNKLRFEKGVTAKDPRLTTIAAEEVSVGVACYLLKKYFGVVHVADVNGCINANELRFVQKPVGDKRPDFFCVDHSNAGRIVESKGAVGTRCAVANRVEVDGWEQVNNVTPTKLPLVAACARIVIGTHFCIDGQHTRSETTTLIKDPPGEPSDQENPDSETAIRLSYAKCFRFIGRDDLAEVCLSGERNVRIEDQADSVTHPQGSFVPLSITPFGDTIGLDTKVYKALIEEPNSILRPAVGKLGESKFYNEDDADAEGYRLPNGIVVIHNDIESLLIDA